MKRNKSWNILIKRGGIGFESDTPFDFTFDK